MNSYHYDRERSTLRECVRILREKCQDMTVDEIAGYINFSVTACRNALKVAMQDGYVRKSEEKRKCCSGQGNLKLTYCATEKSLPEPRGLSERTLREREIHAEKRAALERSKSTDFTPWRHWQDAALFGSPPRVWSTAGRIEPRVFTQPMGIEDEETV